MPPALIIGCGNPLRCDDGIAWHVAEELSRLPWNGDTEILTCHQLTPELAEAVSQAAVVIFVDAARGGTPGEIVSEPVSAQRQSSIFTHEFSPATILSLAQELYGKSPPGYVVAICGECFEHGEVLSPSVKSNLDAAVAVVRELATQASGAVPQPLSS